MIHTFDERGLTGRHKQIRYTINEKGCWECVSHRKGGNGYIFVNRNGKRNTYLHRYSYTLTKGHIPKDMVILHLCDNPICFNPDHLDCDTQRANIRDAVAKGRHTQGEKHGLSKLTAEDVKKIRNDPRIQREIAADYGVTQYNICLIKQNRIWKGIKDE